jgi:hypothetical protein
LDFFTATSSSSIGAGDNGGVIVMSSSVSVDDGLEELDRRGRLLIGDRDNFDPFGELVDGDQQVSVASSR